ncbi:hypothetical protein [Nocardia mangyaensis]|uniref:hypothetical protein n=1 Tax=Nocardia mangyaensis TaxID=2213200 RepID=UPI00267624D7|nr:hypothetical protein [Nocardia mangyaensis]MDO3649513.1 hypothetical protein [Nocardia mangyaensis]
MGEAPVTFGGRIYRGGTPTRGSIVGNAAAVIGQPIQIDLDTDAIRLFAAAARSADPAYRTAEHPVVPPTFLPADAFGAGDRAETDHRFFGRPPRAGDRLTAVRDLDAPESLTRYFDRTGGLVAESWAAAAPVVSSEHAVAEPLSSHAAAQLAAYATDWLGAENIRRFRTRIVRALAPGETVTCSGHLTQHYLQDGEARVDVTLAGADSTGAVVVRAWASFARD